MSIGQGRPGVAKSVAARISDMIASGELRRDERLPSQRDLARALGVSRPAIREAISSLEAAGVLRVEPGRGMYTMAVALVETALPYSRLDMCQFRHLIEGQSARLAAMKITDEGLDQLGRNLQAFKTETRAGDLQASARTDFAFHHLIIVFAGVRLFAHLHLEFRETLLEMLAIPTSQHSRAWEPVPEHERIVEALRRRDPDEARYYMQSHIVRSSERLGIMLASDLI
ncbi:MAG: FadR family transcriptional regulator [Acetobacteraceae bacterium]|nr:FadR family transcriptional regulator [Acetobacteraceae bacterium]